MLMMNGLYSQHVLNFTAYFTTPFPKPHGFASNGATRAHITHPARRCFGKYLFPNGYFLPEEIPEANKGFTQIYHRDFWKFSYEIGEKF